MKSPYAPQSSDKETPEVVELSSLLSSLASSSKSVAETQGLGRDDHEYGNMSEILGSFSAFKIFDTVQEDHSDHHFSGNSAFLESIGLGRDDHEYGNISEIVERFSAFKNFDTVQGDYSDHHFSLNNAFLESIAENIWAKRIQGEWRMLEKDLPDTIFVRAYESRMDLLRAVIIGADGTPYYDGLFFFDVLFPAGYPFVPPKVHYRSGGLRINPNLYDSGTVCLSLLNTWRGMKNEKWMPAKSTMLQVLVSIQGLVLNAEPYFNEPGFEYMRGTDVANKGSLDYHEFLFSF